MEDRLDDVAAGRAAWTDVLADFWTPLAADVAGAAGTAVTDIVDAVDASLGASVLGDDRACPACGDGRLGWEHAIEKWQANTEPKPPQGMTAGNATWHRWFSGGLSGVERGHSAQGR